MSAKNILLLLFLLTMSGAFGQQPLQEGYIPVEPGVTLFYQKVGTAREYLLVPAGFFLFSDFKQLAKDRTVIFYDMRNRGRSSSVDDSTRIGIKKDVQDMEAVRKYFGIDKVSLLGWSYLGLVVMLYTKQFPQHVDRVIQIGPAPLDWNQPFPDSLRHRVPEDSVGLKVVEAAYKAGLYQKEPAKFTRLVFELMEKDRLVGNKEMAGLLDCKWTSFTQYPNEHFEHFMRHMRYQFASVQNLRVKPEDFSDLSHKVLVIHGTFDSHSPFGAGKQWSLILSNAELVRVEGAAHAPWVEQPEKVFKRISAFLKQ